MISQHWYAFPTWGTHCVSHDLTEKPISPLWWGGVAPHIESCEDPSKLWPKIVRVVFAVVICNEGTSHFTHGIGASRKSALCNSGMGLKRTQHLSYLVTKFRRTHQGVIASRECR
jgi:hypothetical protein